MTFLLVTFLLFFIYFLPAILASYYSTGNHVAVLLINLFLGWTVFGWFIALILAIKSLTGRELLKSFLFSLFMVFACTTIAIIEVNSMDDKANVK